jgi:hypothetical protein
MEDKILLSKKEKKLVIIVSSIFLFYLFLICILFPIINRLGKNTFRLPYDEQIKIFILFSLIDMLYTLFIYFLKVKFKFIKTLFFILYWVMTSGLFLLSSYFGYIMGVFQGL